MNKRSALVAIIFGMTAAGCSRGPQPTPKNVELASELIKVAKLDRGMGNLLERAQKDTNFYLPPEFSVSNLEKIQKSYIDAYASVYSAKELKAAFEFFKSPEGQRWVEKQKQVNAKVYLTEEALMPKVVESCKKYFEVPRTSLISTNPASLSNSSPSPAPRIAP